jgi:phage terminase large subunit GpA-like protein
MSAVAAAVDAGGAEGDTALVAAERRRDGRARVAALADMADAVAAAQK